MTDPIQRLKDLPWRKLILALAIGAGGGGIAHALDVPLAWMIGAMGATIAASMANLPVAVPGGLRTAMLTVLGTFLGSTFTPDMLENAAQWPASLSSILVFVALATALSFFYYRFIARMDKVTSLFSATPGSLTAMTVLGTACGGVEQQIALTQGLRVVFIVFLTPVFVFGILDLSPVAAAGGHIPFNPVDSLILIIGGLLGIYAARRIRLPASHMTGPMFVSAALHISGVVQHGLPLPLLDVTLWILGSAIGSRFAGMPLRALLPYCLHAFLNICILFGFTFAAAYLISSLLELDFLVVLLSLAPGGVAEMCLIALALNADPGFVAFHHLARITLILLATPVLGRFMAPARQSPGP